MTVELTDGNVVDFKRSLEMVLEAVQFSQTYFEKQSESMAAMHGSTKVMYSPVVVLLDQAQFKIKSMQNILGESDE